MNFELTEEQKILKSTAHEFLLKECPRELVREIDDNDEGYSRELWQKMADLGWLGFIFPEKYGGSDGSFMDLIVLIEEMGYNISPGPFIPTLILGGLPILTSGNEEQRMEILPAVSAGKMILSMALTEDSASFEASAVKVSASADKNDYIINGTKLFVPYANISKYILCVARTSKGATAEDGITIFIVNTTTPGIEITPLKTLARDKQHEVIFNNVRVSRKAILGKENEGWPIVLNAIKSASLAVCAEMTGGERAVLDLARQYAKDRTQFNHPIGSFQAVQHHFANMWLDGFISSHLLYKAAWKISKGIEADIDVARAKARIGEAYRRVTTLGHQIFGAIGFTMEHDMHLFHRRSMTGDLAFGNGEFHRKKLAGILLS